MRISRFIIGAMALTTMVNQAQAWQRGVQLEYRELWDAQIQEREEYQYVSKSDNVIQENNELIVKIDRALGRSEESSLGEDWLLDFKINS